MTVRFIGMEKAARVNEAAHQKSERCQFNDETGGDDRIRTCGTLLEYNGLANRRFQPLSHVSEYRRESQIFILAVVQTLSRYIASNSPTTLVFGA